MKIRKALVYCYKTLSIPLVLENIILVFFLVMKLSDPLNKTPSLAWKRYLFGNLVTFSEALNLTIPTTRGRVIPVCG